MNRRTMLKSAGGAAALTILGGIPLGRAAGRMMTPVPKKDRKKILVIGAHPDDPETAAGGTMCLLTDAGHEVVSVYLTRGEAGIPGKSHEEAAAIREKEAKAACAVTGARPLFMNQIDGSTEVNLDRYREMVGRRLKVLIEGPSKRGDQLCGRSSDNKMCVFPADPSLRPGDYADVLVEDCTSATLICSVIPSEHSVIPSEAKESNNH